MTGLAELAVMYNFLLLEENFLLLTELTERYDFLNSGSSSFIRIKNLNVKI